MFLGDTTTLMSMSIGVALDPVQCHGQSADQHIFDLVAVQCGEEVEVEHGLFPPGIFQPHRQVKHRCGPLYVIHPIRDKVPVPLKLKLVVWLGLRQ